MPLPSRPYYTHRFLGKRHYIFQNQDRQKKKISNSFFWQGGITLKVLIPVAFVRDNLFDTLLLFALLRIIA